MLDRSRAGCALSAAFAIACLFVLPTAADAAAPPPRAVPADAPTVATTPSGASIIAWVAGGRTCMVLQEAGAPRPTKLVGSSREDDFTVIEGVDGSCETTPVLSQFYAKALGSLTRTDQTKVAWGVAGPSVARLEARRGGAVLTAAATTATASSALPGPAAALRFWALDLPSGAAPAPDEIAVLDASGAVRRTWSAPDFSMANAFDDDPDGRLMDGAILERGRTTSGAWVLRRSVTRELRPTPLEPERRVEVRCLSLVVASKHGDRTGSGGPCDDGGAFAVTPLAVEPNVSCGIGVGIAVLVRAPVRSAVVVLGDGSRRTVPLHAVGGAKGARGGAVVVEPGMAVRRVEGLGAGGGVLRSSTLATAPVRPDCKGFGLGSSSGWTSYGTFGDLFGDHPHAAPHTARAIDSGAQICVAVDRAPRPPLDCDLPPIAPEDASLWAPEVPGGQYLYGLVPVEVTAARVTFTDGTTQVVPATPIPGYAGQYASTTAQIALDVVAPKVVRSSALLDGGGRVLGRAQTLGPLDYVVGASTTLRPAADGLPALRARSVSFTYGRQKFAYTCVKFGATSTMDDCMLSVAEGSYGVQTVTVSVPCAPRRTIVLAALRRATDRLVVRTRDGREVVAGNLRLPAAAGAAAGRSVALAVLGPREAVTGLRLRGRAPRKIQARYPAAAEQCGYADQPGSAFS